MEKEMLFDALHHIPCCDVSTRDWIRIGMALKTEGYQADDLETYFQAWDDWSSEDTARYHSGECWRRWKTFNAADTSITGSTIVWMAKDRGWKPTPTQTYRGRIGCVGDLLTTMRFKRDPVKALLKSPHKTPQEQIQAYIDAVYDPGDTIAYTVTSHMGERKYGPHGYNYIDYTELQDLLQEGYSITQIFGEYNPMAGAWIGFNAVNDDEKDFTSDNISDLKFVLVECDDIPIEEQVKYYTDLRLPIAALIYTGASSAHALVHIDASTKEEYDKRVRFLYHYLKSKGVPIDASNKNPNRWTRLPGAVRGKQEQWLISTNIGPESYYDWVYEITGLVVETSGAAGKPWKECCV